MSSITTDSVIRRPALQASLWMYPWDLLDEGGSLALSRARDLANISIVKVAVTYHAGLFLLPHNPVRRIYTAEDGVLYFRADPSTFPPGLQPTRSEFTRSQDPLQVAERSAQQTGVTLRAWVVCCHNSRLGIARPDLTVINALGDRLPFALCPSQEEVQEYLSAMVGALNSYSGIDAIELEALYWLPAEHAWHHPKFGTPLDPQTRFLLGLCCCSACAKRAEIDQTVLARAIRPHLLRGLSGEITSTLLDRSGVEGIGTEVSELIQAREHVLDSLLRRLSGETDIAIHAMIGNGIITAPWTYGINVAGWSTIADVLTVNTYSNEPARIVADLSSFRALAPDSPLVVGLDATHPVTATASSLIAQSVAALQGKPDELSYYQYGLLSLSRLNWVGQAIRATRDHQGDILQ